MVKKLVAELYLNIEEKGYLGKGRVELLKLIDKLRSILKAAKELRMSYRAAWGIKQDKDSFILTKPSDIIVGKV